MLMVAKIYSKCIKKIIRKKNTKVLIVIPLYRKEGNESRHTIMFYFF